MQPIVPSSYTYVDEALQGPQNAYIEKANGGPYGCGCHVDQGMNESAAQARSLKVRGTSHNCQDLQLPPSEQARYVCNVPEPESGGVTGSHQHLGERSPITGRCDEGTLLTSIQQNTQKRLNNEFIKNNSCLGGEEQAETSILSEQNEGSVCTHTPNASLPNGGLGGANFYWDTTNTKYLFYASPFNVEVKIDSTNTYLVGTLVEIYGDKAIVDFHSYSWGLKEVLLDSVRTVANVFNNNSEKGRTIKAGNTSSSSQPPARVENAQETGSPSDTKRMDEGENSQANSLVFRLKIGDVVEAKTTSKDGTPALWTLGTIQNIKHQFFYITFDPIVTGSSSTYQLIFEEKDVRPPSALRSLRAECSGEINRVAHVLDPLLEAWVYTPEAAACLQSILKKTNVLSITVKVDVESTNDKSGTQEIVVINVIIFGAESDVKTACMLLSIHEKHQRELIEIQQKQEKRLKLLAEKKLQFADRFRREFLCHKKLMGLMIGKNGERLTAISKKHEVDIRVQSLSAADLKGKGIESSHGDGISEETLRYILKRAPSSTRQEFRRSASGGTTIASGSDLNLGGDVSVSEGTGVSGGFKDGSSPISSTYQKVVILGSDDLSVDRARKELQVIFHEYSVDAQRVGWILGRKGTMLKKITETTNLFSAWFDDNRNVLILCGTIQSVEDSILLIDGHCEYYSKFQDLQRENEEISQCFEELFHQNGRRLNAKHKIYNTNKAITSPINKNKEEFFNKNIDVNTPSTKTGSPFSLGINTPQAKTKERESSPSRNEKNRRKKDSWTFSRRKKTSTQLVTKS